MTHDLKRSVFQAPGRVNLIGEHTDYNDGYVLPVAIQLKTHVTAMSASGRKLAVQSALYAEEISFDLDASSPAPRKHWTDYVRGVALSLEQEGFPLRGARLSIESDIPPGAGLSSSAALEVATAMALLSVSGSYAEPLKIAQICHRAENEFVGMRAGIMDQFAACFGRRNQAMLLDCRSLEIRYQPLPAGVAMMVCNTMVRHELASSEYNTRRQQCEKGVALLSRFLPGIRALRDVSPAQLERFPAELEPVIHRRCRHVIEENRRVLAAAEALQRGDPAALGALMVESHQSLRLDYEVSCPELDLMCELALGAKDVYGARMVGGGFGGCVLALVQQSGAPRFRETIVDEYRNRMGIECEIYECVASDGAGEVSEQRD